MVKLLDKDAFFTILPYKICLEIKSVRLTKKLIFIFVASLLVAVLCFGQSAQEQQWETIAGTLAQKRPNPSLNIQSDSVYVAVANGSSSPWSWGWYSYGSRIRASYEAEFTVYIPSKEHKSTFEFYGLGGVFGISTYKGGGFFFYENEKNWSGWKPAEAIKPDAPNRIKIVQNGERISAYINDTFVGVFALKDFIKEEGNIALYHKAMPGVKSEVMFWSFNVKKY